MNCPSLKETLICIFIAWCVVMSGTVIVYSVMMWIGVDLSFLGLDNTFNSTFSYMENSK